MKIIHGVSPTPRAVKKQGYYMILLPMVVWAVLKSPTANSKAKSAAKKIYDHEYAHILQWERGCKCDKVEECANYYMLRGKLLC